MRTDEGRKNLAMIEDALLTAGIDHDSTDLTDLTWEEQQKKLQEKIENSDGGSFLVYDEAKGTYQLIFTKTKEQKAREAELKNRQEQYKAKYEAEVAVMRKSNRAQKRKEQLAKKKAKAVARMNKKN